MCTYRCSMKIGSNKTTRTHTHTHAAKLDLIVQQCVIIIDFFFCCLPLRALVALSVVFPHGRHDEMYKAD